MFIIIYFAIGSFQSIHWFDPLQKGEALEGLSAIPNRVLWDNILYSVSVVLNTLGTNYKVSLFSHLRPGYYQHSPSAQTRLFFYLLSETQALEKYDISGVSTMLTNTPAEMPDRSSGNFLNQEHPWQVHCLTLENFILIFKHSSSQTNSSRSTLPPMMPSSECDVEKATCSPLNILHDGQVSDDGVQDIHWCAEPFLLGNPLPHNSKSLSFGNNAPSILRTAPAMATTSRVPYSEAFKLYYCVLIGA